MMGRAFYRYWFQALSESRKEKNVNSIPYIALLSTLATILQSSGNYVPIIGLFLSAFATLPIMVAAFIGKRAILTTYILTTIILVFMQPSEFFTFPFTTGILGLSFGFGLWIFNNRFWIVLLSGLLLSIGIILLLVLVEFPILGPTYGEFLHLKDFAGIMTFSFLYSWIFFDICFYLFKRIEGKI